MAAREQSQPEPDTSSADGAASPYVVVARRYRPQAFDELIGQEHVARALSGAIAGNRVGHAYLFTGARGVGKTSAARILAKALDCVHGPTSTPCNVCDMCTSISAGSDVDVLEIDGASNRGIDEIRQLRQNVSIRPSRARYKIYIIDEVHMLTREAFNALLKTLEEPPEHVKFIFCTTEVTKIPITILSRCQRFDFAGISQQAIVGRLRQIVAAEGIEVEPEALAILARRAAGSMRDSQSLLEQLLAFGGERITAAEVHGMLGTAGEARLGALVAHLIERNPAAAINDLDGALAEGVEVGQLLEQLLGYFRDTMVALVGCPADSLLHTSRGELAHLREAGGQLGLETLLAVMQIVDHTLARLRYSTQARTLAEMALVRIANLENLDDLASLIAQVRSGADTAEAPSAGAPRTATPSAVSTEAKKKDPAGNGNGALTAPAAPQAATAIPLTEETAAAVWNQALAGMTDMLGDMARQADSVALAGAGRLAVTFRAKYTSCKSYCERPPQLALLENALSAVAGQRVSVELKSIDDAPAELPAAKAPSAAKRRADKAEHPLVRRASELFDARLVRVDEPEK